MEQQGEIEMMLQDIENRVRNLLVQGKMDPKNIQVDLKMFQKLAPFVDVRVNGGPHKLVSY